MAIHTTTGTQSKTRSDRVPFHLTPSASESADSKVKCYYGRPPKMMWWTAATLNIQQTLLLPVRIQQHFLVYRLKFQAKKGHSVLSEKKEYIAQDYEPGRGQLHTQPHVRPISCHVTSLSWQEPEEEVDKLLLRKVSGRDRNVKG